MKDSYLTRLLSENERIMYTGRQHWFLMVSAIAAELLALALIFGTAIALVVFVSVEAPPFVWIVPVAAFILMLAPIATMTRDILQWTNLQYVVTNWRVIQIGGVFNKHVTDSSLEKVNDVKLTQSALGRMFNYGDIEIMTASELGINLFKRIENPVKFKTAMLNAKEALEMSDRRPALAPAPDFVGMIGQLDQLRTRGIITEEEFQQKKADLLARL